MTLMASWKLTYLSVFAHIGVLEFVFMILNDCWYWQKHSGVQWRFDWFKNRNDKTVFLVFFFFFFHWSCSLEAEKMLCKWFVNPFTLFVTFLPFLFTLSSQHSEADRRTPSDISFKREIYLLQLINLAKKTISSTEKLTFCKPLGLTHSTLKK